MTDEEFTEIYLRRVDMVYRLCVMYLKKPADAEDAAQAVFLKLLQSDAAPRGLEHERAWLITTAKNYCKDVLKSVWRTRRVDLEALPELASGGRGDGRGEAVERLLALPEKYKTVLYLYYIEEYSVREIAEMLSRGESTIQSQLMRGRKRLKIDLGGNEHGKKQFERSV
ncbi:MAG: RNA polymerase sigma factor [Oscillospiraceae bacterium]|nr:RNA polymerase sigma factor [Oscillospiraceae bacterium]